MTPRVGDPIRAVKFPPITREQIQRYAEASGDFNPIHLDDEVAKGAGLPGPIAHGMLMAGLLAERANRFIEDELKSSEYQLKEFQTRFKALTLIGDVPSVGGVIREVTDRTLVIDLHVRNQRDEIATIGTARLAKQ